MMRLLRRARTNLGVEGAETVLPVFKAEAAMTPGSAEGVQVSEA